MDNNNRIEEGGFLIPKVAYIEEPRDGFTWRAVRSFGWAIIQLGSRIRLLGYTQREIHPHEDLVNAIKRAKVERGQ